MNCLTFSIVIPTYGRPEGLARCLASLSRLAYSREHFEVIIVDDGSPVALHETVRPYRDSLDITLIRQTNAGPASARNAGASRAKYEYLVFIDDDCAPACDWLEHLAMQIRQTPCALIGGSVVNSLADDVYATASQCLISFLYEYFNPRPQQSTFFTSNNFALSRRLFIEFGGFNSSYRRAAAEDREFCEQWVNGGRQMVFAPQALVHHAHQLTMPKFWRQHFNYGRGAFRFHQLRALRGQKAIRLEPPSFYYGLLAYPFKTGFHRAAEISVLLWISQAANALGFFYERCFHPERTITEQRTMETIGSRSEVIFAGRTKLGASEG